MTNLAAQFLSDKSGAVSVSASWIIGVFIVLTGGGIELSNAYWQANALHHSAKVGVRVAVTSDPVAKGIIEIAKTGNANASYKFICSGKTKSCNQGEFDQTAFDRIVFGKDLDRKCAATRLERRGMCDYFDKISPENVTITYETSGMERTDNSTYLIPLVTVELNDIKQDFVFLDLMSSRVGGVLLKSRAVSVGEDLRTSK